MSGAAWWRGRYEPIEVVGRGRQGRVIRALDHQHGRTVALKVRPLRSPAQREELLSEARLLLGLDPHPGLPLVRDDFFTEDEYVVVMDWVGGADLGALLVAQGDPGLPTPTVLGWLTQLADALDHLHRQRPPVVHGDVKPANAILAATGRVALVDFGLARAVDQPGRRAGTPGFRAPEGGASGPAADIYGLAATAVALLTGHPPSGGQPRWDGVAPGVAAALERGLRRGLAVDPARRPGSAGELIERLVESVGGALPIGVVTFCATEVADAAVHWEASPETMAESMARQEALVAEAVEAHAGRLLALRGETDATLSVFGRASDAVSAALALRRASDGAGWPNGLRPELRIALHAGEATLRDGRYTGATLARALGLRTASSDGQIVCSRAVAEMVTGLVGGVAGGRVRFVELGPRVLAERTRPETVFEIVELAADPAAERDPSARIR
ncbi:MAG: protein kinase domain-containing protein [Acidimicrobiales bacterium]